MRKSSQNVGSPVFRRLDNKSSGMKGNYKRNELILCPGGVISPARFLCAYDFISFFMQACLRFKLNSEDSNRRAMCPTGDTY